MLTYNFMKYVKVKFPRYLYLGLIEKVIDKSIDLQKYNPLTTHDASKVWEEFKGYTGGERKLFKYATYLNQYGHGVIHNNNAKKEYRITKSAELLGCFITDQKRFYPNGEIIAFKFFKFEFNTKIMVAKGDTLLPGYVFDWYFDKRKEEEHGNK